MPHSQIEKDLCDNAHKRIVQWRKDTIWRCEAVNMDNTRIASMLITVAMTELFFIASKLNMRDEDLGILAVTMYAKYKREVEGKRHESRET